MTQKVSDWLFEKFLSWQASNKERYTITDLANEIGVSQATVSTWLSGERLPNHKNAPKIARLFGEEIYDLLGMINPDLKPVSRNWHRLSEGDKQKIMEIMDRYDTNMVGKDERSRNSYGSLADVAPHCKD